MTDKRHKPLPHYTTGGPYVPSVRVKDFDGPYYNAYTGEPIPKPSFATPIMGPCGKPITPHGVIVTGGGVGMTHIMPTPPQRPVGMVHRNPPIQGDKFY